MSDPAFTVCVLGFGDCVSQLARCLMSVAWHLPDPDVAEVRVGLNRPSRSLLDLAEGLVARVGGAVVADAAGEAKYPMMRRLLHETPVSTEFVMWFDDDSWIKDDAPPGFFADCARAVADGVDLAGARYTWPLRPGQPEWIAAQPWYDGRPFAVGQRVPFFQGAWWIARAARLREADYPWPELHHNGGDVMLGVMAACRRWETRHFRPAVAINADDAGNESKGPRGGLDAAPIGARG